MNRQSGVHVTRRAFNCNSSGDTSTTVPDEIPSGHVVRVVVVPVTASIRNSHVPAVTHVRRTNTAPTATTIARYTTHLNHARGRDDGTR
jgi:hypothetical protein